MRWLLVMTTSFYTSSSSSSNSSSGGTGVSSCSAQDINRLSTSLPSAVSTSDIRHKSQLNSKWIGWMVLLYQWARMSVSWNAVFMQLYVSAKRPTLSAKRPYLMAAIRPPSRRSSVIAHECRRLSGIQAWNFFWTKGGGRWWTHDFLFSYLSEKLSSLSSTVLKISRFTYKSSRFCNPKYVYLKVTSSKFYLLLWHRTDGCYSTQVLLCCLRDI